MFDKITLIGITASIFTGVSLLPQLVKTYKEKDCSISIGMLAVLFLGNGLWTAYGALKNDFIIIISNSFSILVNLSLSILWLRFRKKNKEEIN